MQDSFLRRFGLVLIFAIILIGSACSRHPRVRIVAQQSTPFLQAATHQIAATLEKSGFNVSISSGIDANAGLADSIVLNTADPRSAMKAESFEVEPIHANGFTIVRVTGADAKAALWGGMEAADQIIAHADIAEVGTIHGTAYLSTRASQIPLPVGLSETIERQEWSDYFDNLVRDRFNTIIFRISAKLERLTPPMGEERSDLPTARDRRENVALAQSLFQLARERGLTPILMIEKGAVAGLINNAPPLTTPVVAVQSAPVVGAVQPENPDTPIQPRHTLPQLVPLLLKLYPELGGLAISEELIFTYAPPERRAGWVAESILAPLATLNDKKVIFIGTTGEWWPGKAEFGAVAPGITFKLLTSIRKLNDMPASNDVPVLWAAETSSDLLPWQDANAIRDIVKRIGARSSAGFLEDARQPGAGALHPPVTGDLWFRAYLWGRLAHSPDLSSESISNRFAQEFGGAGGPYVFTAAATANQIRSQLASLVEQSSATNGDTGSEISLFTPPSKVSGKDAPDALVDALVGEGLISAADSTPKAESSNGENKVESPGTLDALLRSSELVLSSVAEAEKKSAWKLAETEKFRSKIKGIARSGIAYAGLVRAQGLLVRFTVTGKDEFRQQAIQILTGAQKGLASAQSSEVLSSFPNVASKIESQLTFAKQVHPLQWEKASWDIGVKAAWQPTSPGETPIPSEWRKVQTSQLPEFGTYGRASRFFSLNTKLRTAFIPVDGLGAGIAGGYFVAKATFKASRAARLVVRLISDTPTNVWINKLQSVRLAQSDFPWMDRVPLSGQLQTFLYFLPVQIGDVEIMIGATAKQNWPKVSASYLLAPDPSETVTINAREPTSKDALVVIPGTDANVPPSIQLDAGKQPGSGQALYRFRIRNAGLYRVKLLSQWVGAGHPFTTVLIDGVPTNFTATAMPSTNIGWRWASLDAAAALGSGEHTLTVTGWNPGELLANIEVRPAW